MITFNLHLVVAVLLLWLPQNVLHESSHALVAKALGAQKISINPFPSFKDGTLRFASCSWVWTETPRASGLALAAIAPLLANTIFLTVASLLKPSIENLYLAAIVDGFLITNFLDGSFNALSILRPASRNLNTDAWTWRNNLAMPLISARIAVIIWVLFWLYQLLSPVGLSDL